MGHGGSQTVVVDCQEKNILARLKARYNDLEAKPSYSALDSSYSEWWTGAEGGGFREGCGHSGENKCEFQPPLIANRDSSSRCSSAV